MTDREKIEKALQAIKEECFEDKEFTAEEIFNSMKYESSGDVALEIAAALTLIHNVKHILETEDE